MTRQRRNFKPEFKSRVALEALKGLRTISEIAQEESLHPVQVSEWKKELQDRMSELFERKNAKDEEKARLVRHSEQNKKKVGQLTIEKEFLEKKCDQLGIDVSGMK